MTYKLTDSTKKEILQHRNNLLPYHPKEHALRKLTQLYSFTVLKVIQNHPHTEKEIDEQRNIHQENQTQIKAKINQKLPDPKIPQRERKNRKMIKKFSHKNN